MILQEDKNKDIPDPQRPSSIRFNKSRCRLPPLLHDQLMSIARDTDYFLYEQTKGYVPLDFPTLQARYYHMKDVFQNMTQDDVALWATTIIYNFIKFDVLEVVIDFSSFNQRSKYYYMYILGKISNEKYQRIRCLYNMLRYIQQVGYVEAFTKIFELTPNGNQMHSYLNEMCEYGKLDPDVIDILLRRRILYLWKGMNPIHLQLLLPMCSICTHFQCTEKQNAPNH